MFDKLFRYQRVLARHRDGPFAQEREAYLSYRAQQGASKETLLNIARELLVIQRWIRLSSSGEIDTTEIENAAERWARYQQRRHRSRTQHWPRVLFILRATQWLRFMGRFKEAKEGEPPFSSLLNDFVAFISNDRGLSSATVRNYCWQLRQFMAWWSGQSRPFSEISVTDVDSYVVSKGTSRWSRVSVACCTKALRAFFLHAEKRAWCPCGIAAAIESPRIFRQEGLPTGPAWSDVQRLIANTQTDRPYDIRDQSMLMLFAIYGLRGGEVAKLRLEDFDWERGILTVLRPKQLRAQQFPLTQGVGEAVIRYLKEVRPCCTRREVFLTLKAPFRPLSPGALHHMVCKRFLKLGIAVPHRGPHALRHACAGRLVSEGFSLKEIGDHLGHRSSYATRTYAKVDLAGLREVASFDLGGLL